jgi:acyl-coenzyme A thioesterase PaaI-like protein
MTKPIFHRVVDQLPTSVVRLIFNCWPPFRGAGIKVTRISPDYRLFEVSLKLKLLNRNYVGVHFGGSLFSMADPFYMIMLTKNLGNEYIVWDKAAKIEFKKPGRGNIHATFILTDEELKHIKNEADRMGKYIFDRTVDLLNHQNEVIATVTKTLYVRKKTQDTLTS